MSFRHYFKKQVSIFGGGTLPDFFSVKKAKNFITAPMRIHGLYLFSKFHENLSMTSSYPANKQTDKHELKHYTSNLCRK